MLVLDSALVYIQNDLLLRIWHILRRRSWTSRSLNIRPRRLDLHWRLDFNVWLLSLSLIRVDRQIPIVFVLRQNHRILVKVSVVRRGFLVIVRFVS